MVSRTFWIVENSTPIQYERRGDCNNCGTCCYTDMKIAGQFFTQPDDDESSTNGKDKDHWLEWEGWSVSLLHDVWWWWKIQDSEEKKESLCSCLENNRCGDWETEGFPDICRDWPVHPDNLAAFPECGFHFERVDHDK